MLGMVVHFKNIDGSTGIRLSCNSMLSNAERMPECGMGGIEPREVEISDIGQLDMGII